MAEKPSATPEPVQAKSGKIKTPAKKTASKKASAKKATAKPKSKSAPKARKKKEPAPVAAQEVEAVEVVPVEPEESTESNNAGDEVGVPWHRGVIDEWNLLRIENAWAAGCNTWPEVCERIGIKVEAIRYALHIPEDRILPWQVHRKQEIQQAYKRGLARRTEKLTSLAETSLVKLLSGYTNKTTVTEKRRVPVRVTRAVDGSEQTVYRESVFIRTSETEVAPSVTAVIFTICNTDPLRWKSVNRTSGEDGSSAGAILDWIRDQAKTGREMVGKFDNDSEQYESRPA